MEHGPRQERAPSGAPSFEKASFQAVENVEPGKVDPTEVARLKEKHGASQMQSSAQEPAYVSHDDSHHGHHPGFFGRTWGRLRGFFGLIFLHAWAGIKESAGAGFGGGGGGGHKKSAGGGGHGGGGHH